VSTVSFMEELRYQAEYIRRRELSRALRKSSLFPEERDVVEQLSRSLVDALQRSPVARLMKVVAVTESTRSARMLPPTTSGSAIGADPQHFSTMTVITAASFLGTPVRGPSPRSGPPGPTLCRPDAGWRRGSSRRQPSSSTPPLRFGCDSTSEPWRIDFDCGPLEWVRHTRFPIEAGLHHVIQT
jgi:hypothetical protein